MQRWTAWACGSTRVIAGEQLSPAESGSHVSSGSRKQHNVFSESQQAEL